MAKMRIKPDAFVSYLEGIGSQLYSFDKMLLGINTEINKLMSELTTMREMVEDSELLEKMYRDYETQCCRSEEWLGHFSNLNKGWSAELLRLAEEMRWCLASCGNGWDTLLK